MTDTEEVDVPTPGQWPADPQEDRGVTKDFLWVDGCFDFNHHGHAGALLQARRLGQAVVVGVHSDKAILCNKGPTVMTLEERVAAVEACRWVTQSVPCAPYVTRLAWVSHYGCYYVVHGDDISSDASGEDCYRYVKQAGRFMVVKRTPGVSTTDIVGRMLLCTKDHFVKSLPDVLAGIEGYVKDVASVRLGHEMLQTIREYATDETGLGPGPEVWTWSGSSEVAVDANSQEARAFSKLVDGVGPKPGQKIVYVDGGFDLFSSGHIEFLKRVHQSEHQAYVVAGLHDDQIINHWKGLNYPIMNIFERGLCLLQCKYIHAVIFGAPFSPSKAYLRAVPMGRVSVVYHGPTTFMPLTYDPYTDAKEMGIFRQIESHKFAHVNAGEIVLRIVKARQAFEDRQKKKGEKSIGEEAVKRRELLEEEQRASERKILVRKA